ncbi:MAG TPA: hypothetical protein VH475_14675 [Tepidisphaeraceae bacterium]
MNPVQSPHAQAPPPQTTKSKRPAKPKPDTIPGTFEELIDRSLTMPNPPGLA